MAKKAAKKTAKKAVKSGTPQPSKAKDIFDPSFLEMIDHVHGKMLDLSARRKNKPVNLCTMADVRKELIPLRHFYWQWLIDSYGFPHGTLIELIAADGIGKTTLTLSWLAAGLLSGSPVLYIEGEGKPILGSRAVRAMHTNPAIAQQMVERMSWASAHSLQEMETVMNDWIGFWRGTKGKGGAPLWPMDKPLMVAVDPWSKLLTQEQARGFYDYGKNMEAEEAKKFKATGEGGNFAMAKWAQDWSSKLATLMCTQNVTVILTHHQNDDLGDMNAPTGGFKPQFQVSPLTKELRNRTHKGGRGLNQICALQFIMAKMGDALDDEKKPRGRKIRIRVEKNSYGPNNRTIDFELRNEHGDYDTEGYLDPAIHTNGSFARWLADRGYLGVKVNDDLYSLDDFAIRSVSADKLGDFVSTNDLLCAKLGKNLRLNGFESPVDDVLVDLEATGKQSAPTHETVPPASDDDE